MATTPKELATHLETVASGKKMHPIIEKGLNEIIASLSVDATAGGEKVDYGAIRQSALSLAGKAKIYGEGMIGRELKTAAKIIQVFQFTS